MILNILNEFEFNEVPSHNTTAKHNGTANAAQRTGKKTKYAIIKTLFSFILGP